MASVYPGSIKKLAHQRGVNAFVRACAEEVATKARAILEENHSAGNAAKGTSPTISVERANSTDWRVVLDDPDGGALAIEFGRIGGVDKNGNVVGPMEPIAPLRKAIGSYR